jgi:biopolymer transport protein ExbD
MPIHPPGRRAGSGAVLRSAKRAMSGKSNRSIFAALNLTSMVDFMTVVVIFLLMQFSTSPESLVGKDIMLPEATSTQQLESVPVIGITKDSILLNQQLVTSVGSMLNADAPVIQELMAQLDAARREWTTMNPGQEFNHRVIIQADENIDFKLVKKVMSTATVAQYNNMMFATRVGSRPKPAGGTN